jgi:hypothetical protein
MTPAPGMAAVPPAVDDRTMSRHADALLEDSSPPMPHSQRLARLVLVPAFTTARERLDSALGPELARFLIAALTAEGRGGTEFA